jgi:1-deoxyxylulose-5-phosphate synthase
MEHRRLGKTGLSVSRACLGTMTFGLQCDEPASFAILDAAAEAGITFLDTADVYPFRATFEEMGRSEEIVGKWLRGKRDQFILTTKCGHATGPSAWERGGSRRHILDSIERSLVRLQTDYVDLYLLHRPDPETPIDETLDALDSVVRSGKARYVGVSNFLAYQVARALGRSEAKGVTAPTSIQIPYNLLSREFEREMQPFCAEEGLGVTVFNPIAGGLLSGKHQQENPAGRFLSAPGYRALYWHDRAFALVDTLRPLATSAGLPLAAMAVAWVAANPVVTSVILGATRPEHITSNIKGLEKPLDPELKARLDELSSVSHRGAAA